ncbi:hypothetical protein [Rubellimicrobium thermophilum]|uniref:hypothetical protein n=1 Tax=Rubellimicrobium thermophilum TaxID=295419 RepID=UPI000408F577|nr:hypothetical protein [Rubellimicrobium thermophilum]
MRPLPLLTLLATLTFIGSAFLFPFRGYDGGQVPIPQPDPPVQPPRMGLLHLDADLSRPAAVGRDRPVEARR